MIVSSAMGRQIIPEIESTPQLESVYVFCGNKSAHKQWASKISKVKGVYTDIKSICKALQIDRENCDRAMISISFKGIDALFMYTQLLKEAILQIEDDDTKSLKELGHYCRLEEDIPEDEIALIEREYRSHTPIWWYTAPYFLYSMVNRGLRLMDTDIIMKTGFFMRHLQKHWQDSKMAYIFFSRCSLSAVSCLQSYDGHYSFLQQELLLWKGHSCQINEQVKWHLPCNNISISCKQ